MKFLSVKNIEKYHPKYTDRKLHFGKFYFSMVNTDAEFMLLDEIDRWRFVAFVMIQLDSGKPVPLDSRFLILKGFELKKRPIELTVNMLHNLTEVCENPLQNFTVNSISPCLSEVKRSEAKLDSKNENNREFLLKLKDNPAYKHIEFERELSKMDAWLLAHPGKQKTRRFVVNWLNKIDKPLEKTDLQTLKDEEYRKKLYATPPARPA